MLIVCRKIWHGKIKGTRAWDKKGQQGMGGQKSEGTGAKGRGKLRAWGHGRKKSMGDRGWEA